MFQANPGVLLTLDNQMHGLEDGDKIEFKEIVGMTALNGTTQTVKGNASLDLEFRSPLMKALEALKR